MYQQGYDDAVASIAAGPGNNMRAIVDNYKQYKKNMFKGGVNKEHKDAMNKDFSHVQSKLVKSILGKEQ